MLDQFDVPPWEFTEQELINLVNDRVPEGQSLEYKRSELLKNKNTAIADLTKLVSAFNNATGGVVVVGIEESRQGNFTYPDKVDSGVPASEFTVTWLNQIIQSNIDPQILGLRVHDVPIPISGGSQGQRAFVVYVPAGKRAVQAKDFIYYQRHEDQSVPIRDFLVRDVNNRLEGPDLQLEITLHDDGRLSRVNTGSNTGAHVFEVDPEIRTGG